MSERENILGRIREALTVPAPAPGHKNDGALPHGPTTAEARRWLPAAGETYADQLALFQKNAADLKAVVYLTDTREDFARLLVAVRDSEGWKKAGAHGGKLTDAACRALALPVCRTDPSYNVTDLENCDVGITECDALVAQTGSVLVTSRSAGGRALSVLPPHHVVLARRSQLLRDLPETFAFLKTTYASGYPSFISFITGPSRTGDIERILVLGAHGPKKLTIFLIADEILQ